LRGLGFAIVLYANAALQATILAVQDVLAHLRRTGSLAEIEHKLVSFSERQRIVGKDAFDALEAYYATREAMR
jgi:2-methylisocitrate lyase-like PEP mutase family enzyme